MSAENVRQSVRNLEKSVLAGDVGAMARLITEIHGHWDALGEDEQNEVLKLEAMFISLVHMHVKGNA